MDEPKGVKGHCSDVITAITNHGSQGALSDLVKLRHGHQYIFFRFDNSLIYDECKAELP